LFRWEAASRFGSSTALQANQRLSIVANIAGFLSIGALIVMKFRFDRDPSKD
jgi:hypothetical protein